MGKQEGREVCQDRQALDAMRLCEALCLGICRGFHDFAALENYVGMSVEGKRDRVVGLDCLRVFKDGGMATAIERNIVCGCFDTRRTETTDSTHVARKNGVMTFHLHHHQDGRNVARDNDHKGALNVHGSYPWVICWDANSKLLELLSHWPKE